MKHIYAMYVFIASERVWLNVSVSAHIIESQDKDISNWKQIRITHIWFLNIEEEIIVTQNKVEAKEWTCFLETSSPNIQK